MNYSDFLFFGLALFFLLPLTSWIRVLFLSEKPIIVYVANMAIGLLTGSVSYNLISDHNLGVSIPLFVIYWSYRARHLYDSKIHLYLPPVLFTIAFSLFYFQYANGDQVITF